MSTPRTPNEQILDRAANPITPWLYKGSTEKRDAYALLKQAADGRAADELITLPNGEVRPLGRTIGWIDNNVNAGFAKLQGSIDGLAAALAAATTNPGINPAEIRSLLEGAAEKAFGRYELEVRRVADVQDQGGA